ncbi:N-acetyltransferase GCN5 [Haloterrigena salina JCM 13891]|uniref:N-acetyltransferase GCN5 n=1 Tax=Haloterrigena salina JCM 13891 TaxID=1227488 RepID=M0CL53_9EURY|nr:N-acetyltransferase GCN5 [Haloterrigena salina JCM 13891]
MTADARIRVATPDDAAAVRDIYAPFCESTAVTFEEAPPTEAEVADRIASTLETYPWLVCEREGAVVGYAYASRLRKRRAYQWTVELSVYVADDDRQSGIGRALYESLFAVLERQGVRDAYAVTTGSQPRNRAVPRAAGLRALRRLPGDRAHRRRVARRRLVATRNRREDSRSGADHAAARAPESTRRGRLERAGSDERDLNAVKISARRAGNGCDPRGLPRVLSAAPRIGTARSERPCPGTTVA